MAREQNNERTNAELSLVVRNMALVQEQRWFGHIKWIFIKHVLFIMNSVADYITLFAIQYP